MERLLHYVWKYRLYDASQCATTTGTIFTVLDPGQPNPHAGPDFFNAKIKVGQTVWAGDIEIHDKASDWFHHKHDRDKAYDTVILHVTGRDDATVHRTNGETIPQMVLAVPEKIRKNIDWLLARDLPVPCLERLGEIDPAYLALWMDALLIERLERKAADIGNYLRSTGGDWNGAFYILLTRSFGSGVNSDAFEWLARSLPLRCILKQRNSQSQVEALLFGQAGMLEQPPGDDPYYGLLRREYQFLRYKYGLKPLEESLFKKLRIRPSSFPHLKLAQLAAIWTRHDTLFSTLLEAATPGEVKALLRVLPSDYWLTHRRLQQSAPSREKPMGESFLHILLINAVVPCYIAYGRHCGQLEYVDRALRLLEILPPEQNYLVRLFTSWGISVHNAGDSQALIQLKRAYCEQKKCLHCRIGFKLLQTAPRIIAG